MMIVLFVEDDGELAQQTIDFLENESIDVDYAGTAKQALALADFSVNNQMLGDTPTYDAIILDMNLPDGNGVALARVFTEQSPDIPIIFLTGQDNITDKVAAFNAGALDYLTKPFNMAELAIRLKVLNRKQHSNVTTFTLGDLSVNFSEKIIKRYDRAITLSPQQWLLLALLSRHSPAFVAKQTIINTVWQDTDVSNDMYKSLISRLRNNLSRNEEPALLFIANKQGVALRASD